jgi:hypothetical protein
MALEGRTTCAVHGYTLPISGPNNLCDDHPLPGGVVQVENSTMVTTAWAVEHGNEAGMIFLNDYALGDLFGGFAGFVACLREQGFENIRNVATLAELGNAAKNKKFGDWSGPWRTKYPWERAH